MSVSGVGLLLSVVLVLRGLLGALEEPQSAGFLIAAAAVAELLASVFRYVWRHLHPNTVRATKLLVQLVLPSFCVVCLALAFSMTGVGNWAVATLWLIVASGELCWWYPEISGLRIRQSEHRQQESLTAAAASALAPFDEPIEEGEEVAANVIQQMTRSRDDAGVEAISGILRAEFAPHERTRNLHVAFCPPLPYEPEVVAHQLDGPPVTIKVGQREVFGTRIELRLDNATEIPNCATIYFDIQPRLEQAIHDAAAD